MSALTEIEAKIIKEEQKAAICHDLGMKNFIEKGIEALKAKAAKIRAAEVIPFDDKFVIRESNKIQIAETYLPIGTIIPEGKIVGVFYKVLPKKKDGKFGGLPKNVEIK